MLLCAVDPCAFGQPKVFDLLDATNAVLPVQYSASARAFCVSGLLAVACKSFAEFERVVREGVRNRRVGSTALNKDSSRSHRWGAAGDSPTLHRSACRCCARSSVRLRTHRARTVPCQTIVMRNLANVVLNPTPSILTVTVRQAKTDPHDGHVVSTRGKVVFVDLAGAIAVLPRASAPASLKGFRMTALVAQVRSGSRKAVWLAQQPRKLGTST